MHIATFTLELKATARKDKTHALRIRITKFREHAYWNLGKYILKGELNPAPKPKLKNWVIKSDDAPQINYAIDKAFKGLEKISDKNPALTAAGIKEAYRLELNPEAEEVQGFRSYFAFAEELLARRSESNFRTGKEMGYRVAQFKKIAGENTPFNELFTARMLHKYVQAMKAKGNTPETIKNKLKDLRTIYNAGVNENQFPNLGNPFTAVTIIVPKKKKARPTAAQVKQFINYEPKNALQVMAKTVAMLQYLLQGARVGEALTLEWANVNTTYVEYLPQKEAMKPKFIPRSPLLNKLLSELPKTGRYVLPYIGEDYYHMLPKQKTFRKGRIVSAINKGLKEIAEALEIDIKLSSHMFRHAFADALIAAGANPHTAAALLGHASAKTSEAYFKELGLEDTSDIALSIFDKLEDNLGEQ